MANSNTPVLDAEVLRLFANSIERYGQDKYSFNARKPLLHSPPGFSVQAWSDYADMGWLAAPLPLEDGGFGSHPVAVAALMRYAGEHLALEPLFASVVVCGRLLALCGTSGGAHQRLGALAAGTRLFALAHAENTAAALDSDVATHCHGGRLSGRKVVVLHGDVADELIVSARESSEAAGPGPAGDGLSLFAVNVKQPGVHKTCYRLLDGRGAASFEFEHAGAELIAPSHVGAALLANTLDDGRLALCAEAHGAMRALNRQTLAYLKDRRQFGRPIGSNQVLQHRMVDLFMLEQEVAAVVAAAQRAVGQNAWRQRAIMGAVSHAITAGRQISHEAVQMHGGIGTTDELAVSHYFKRIMVVNRLLGDRDAHLDAFARADAACGAMVKLRQETFPNEEPDHRQS